MKQRGRIWRPAQVIAVAVGTGLSLPLLGLLAYVTGVQTLAQVVPHGTTMVPQTAVALLLAFAGLWLIAPRTASRPRRLAGRLLGLPVMLIGAGTVFQDVTGLDLGVDTLLFHDRLLEWSRADQPGRPSQHTAVALLLAGLSLLLLDADARHGHRPAQVLAPAGGLLAATALLGHAYDVSYLSGESAANSMAYTTAASFVLLSIGTLACRPELAAARVFLGVGPGGAAVRRLAPAMFLTVLIVGVLIKAAGMRGHPAGGAAATAAAGVLVLLLYLMFLRAGSALNAASQAVRDEHEFSQAVLHSLRDGVITLAADGAVMEVTPRWSEITGFTAEDVAGCTPPYPWWPPDGVAELAANRATALAATSTVDFDMVIRRKDGTDIDVRVTVSPVRRQDGPRMLVCTYRDLTERNRDEAERRRAAEQLNHFFDISTDLLCIAGVDGRFHQVNPAWERTFGYTAEELTSRPYLDFVHPDDVARTGRESAEQIAAGRASVAFENRYRCRDGTYRWLNWNAIPTPDGTIYAVARDTTEQRRAGEARARLAAIVSSTRDAVVGTTLDGTITSWNPGAERLYGHPADEAIDRHLALILPAGRHDEIAGTLARVARGEPVELQDTVRVRRDGTLLHVAESISPIRDADGAVVAAACIARDVTDRVKVEQALALARDEALAATQLKSQFVAMVSHEIRTPMNGVIGLTNLLLQAPLEPGPRRYAEAIRASGRALLAIINDILDFSKIEAGRIELVDVDYDLGRLLEETIQAVAEAARGKDLEILAYYPPDLPTSVRGDAGRLRQALLNLLGNAVKFTGSGEVLLRAEPAGPGPDHRPRVTFTVSDTGIGIADKDLDRLFEPFSQIDAATNREFGGTGLGLSITRQLIDLMDGRLEVDSRPGHGSRFWFTVPVTPRPEPADRRSAKDLVAARTVLVVDDNPTSRDLITRHATAWGMAPAAAHDGHAALERLRAAARDRRPYDVAVIDQHMPGLDGVTLAARIAADPDIPPTGLVLLTSGTYADDQRAATAGADAVLRKPVGPSQLYNCLVELLDPDAAARAARVSAPAPAPPPAAGGRGRILLAEDNAINQMVAVDTLSMLGYEVDIARNGLEALQLAESRQYVAVLMDCQMPKMDGYTATTRLREHEQPDRHVPIIAMTAGALTEDRQRCLAAGMDDYLAKPIDPDQLQAALDRWTREPTPGPGR